MKVTMLYDLGPLDDLTITGGIESHIIALIREFNINGIKCNYITGSIPGMRREIMQKGIELERLNFPGLKQTWNPFNLKFSRQFLFLTAAIIRCISRDIQSSDIYHGHIYSGGLAALMNARMRKKRAVNTIHGSYYDYWFQLAENDETAILLRTMEKILSKNLAKFSDLQIHTDKYFAGKVREFGAAKNKIITIHNGVDDSVFNPSVDPLINIKRKFNMSEGPLLMTVRRLVPKNGIEDLIRACKIVSEHREFTLLVCGEGPQRLKLESLVYELGIQDRIVFTGRIPNVIVPRFLKVADLVIIPSLVEASSISLIETMLVKTPCVVTRIPGITEIASESMVTFSEPSDPGNLAGVILKALDNPKLLKNKAEKAFRYAKRNLTIKKCAK
ncbi:MAG: glycosyltransferase family 4 protein, partial [Candidatus Hodarchaeales archaeon]